MCNLFSVCLHELSMIPKHYAVNTVEYRRWLFEYSLLFTQHFQVANSYSVAISFN